MKLINTLLLFSTLFSQSIFANAAAVNQQLLYGSWLCEHEIDHVNPKMKVKISATVNFLKSGQSSGEGSVLFNMANLPELEYSLTSKATWEVTKNKLLLSTTEMTSKNISHPELDKFLNLDSFIPKKVSQSSTILTLSKSRLKVRSESDGGVYTCSKVTP